MNNETLTTPAVRKMIRPYLTGDDKADAIKLQRRLRYVGMTRQQWRGVIAETKAVA